MRIKLLLPCLAVVVAVSLAARVHSQPEKAQIKGHTDAVSAITFDPSGEQFLTGSMDGTVKVWDTKTRKCLTTIPAVKDFRVNALALSPDNKWILVGCFDGPILVYPRKDPKEFAQGTNTQAIVARVGFSRDGKLFFASAGRSIAFWKLDGGELQTVLEKHKNVVTGFDLSADEKTLVSADSDGVVKVWDLAGKKELASHEFHKGIVRGVAFADEDRLILSGSADKGLVVWDRATGKRLSQQDAGSVSCFAMSAKRKILAVGTYDSRVFLFSVPDMKQIKVLDVAHSVVSLAVSPDEKTLLVGYGSPFAAHDAPSNQGLFEFFLLPEGQKKE